jgi:hypothetical protein
MAKSGQHQNPPGLVHPLADTQTTDRYADEGCHNRNVDNADEPDVARQPFTPRTDDIAEVLSDLKTGLGCVEDGEEPEIPRDQKSRDFAEPELRPLVKPSLERHRTIEMNNDRRRGYIDKGDRGQPENDVRGSLLRGDTNPGQADDEENLGEGEIDEAEILSELGAMLRDGRLVSAHFRHAAEYMRRAGALRQALKIAPALDARRGSTWQWEL